MRSVARRCSHCKRVYAYVESGYPAVQELNDDRYCEDCKAVILGALKNVPIKVSKVWEEVQKPDYATLARWETEAAEAQANNLNNFFGPVRRVPFPLFDAQSGKVSISRQYVAGRRRWQGRQFMYEVNHKTDIIKVFMAMGKDMETGKSTPWQEV